MKRLLIALMLSVQPALALNAGTGSGYSPIIVFRNHAQRTLEVLYTPASTISSPDDAYDFNPTNNDMNITNYLNTGAGYIYSPPPVPVAAVVPNLVGFVTAIKTDSTFTPAVRIGFAALLALVQTDAGNPPAMQQDWADAVATYGSTWLTPAVQATTLAYAKTYNIPLVANP